MSIQACEGYIKLEKGKFSARSEIPVSNCSRSRSLSPDGQIRSLSPRKSRPRSRSLSPDGQSRSMSPTANVYRIRSLSPDGQSRIPNPRKYRDRSRSLSPDGQSRSLSPRKYRPRSRSPSPRKYRDRCRSPIKRNADRYFKSRDRSPIRQYTNYRNGPSGQTNLQKIPANNQMGKFSTMSRSRSNSKYFRTPNSNMFGLRVKKGKNAFLPSALFQVFADMLNKYGNSSRFDKSVEEMENMFRGVETSDQLIRQIGLDKALRILSMYVMTNGKFRKAYKGYKQNRKRNLFDMF